MEKRAPRALWRFIALVLFALSLQGIPMLFMALEGDAGAALYFLHLYGILPLGAFLAAFWAGYGGVHPLAAFFPVGGALLLLPVFASVGMGLICLLLSLIGAVAGQEWKKRRANEKGSRHGRT